MKIPTKTALDASKSGAADKAPASADLPQELKVPVELLFQFAEHGGVQTHALLSSLNQSFQKAL